MRAGAGKRHRTRQARDKETGCRPAARAGVGGGFLHVAERDPGVRCCGDECVPGRAGAGGLGDSGASGGPADDPPGAVPVQPPAICGQEDGSFAALADGQVYCPRGAGRERDGDDLAALAGDPQGRVPAFDAVSNCDGTRADDDGGE